MLDTVARDRVKCACHGNRPEQSARAAPRPGLDAAATRRRGGRVAPEYQLDRVRPIRPEPGARPDLCAGFRSLDRLDLRTGEEAMKLFGGNADERILAHRLHATSAASFAGIIVAMGLFIYH